ncbi:hypothetical protein [Paraburkholderia caribensis]|uniref:lysozyme inhibitor LprI family protein n=1 Tax=Paraburkholderia caribensis TaxID=75105 RepID=UPI0031E3DAD8
MFEIMMRNIVNLIFSVIALTVVSINPAFSAGMPANLIGVWQVRSVHLNTGVGRATEYQWDDPRLTGRIFRFGSDEISDDALRFGDKCENVKVESVDVTFPDLIRRSLGGYVGEAGNPIDDYKLPLEGNKKYSAMTFNCKNGPWQGDLGNTLPQGIKGAWIVSSGGDLYLRWRDETILILSKIDLQAKVDASFDCSKATVRAERAICNSYQLGALDNSIHNAYVRLLRQIRSGGGSISEISKNQRTWTAQRNACGNVSKCLNSVMMDRLQWLGEQLQN